MGIIQHKRIYTFVSSLSLFSYFKNQQFDQFLAVAQFWYTESLKQSFYSRFKPANNKPKVNRSVLVFTFVLPDVFEKG